MRSVLFAQGAGVIPQVTMVVAAIAAVTALIGAAVAAVTASTRQRRELAHDRQLGDLTELRSVLDEAARVLARAGSGLNQLVAGRAPSDVQMAGLRTVDDELDEMSRRIRIRLGPGAVLTAFDAARAAHATVVDDADADATGGAGYAEWRVAFDAAHDEWFVAAHQLVGSAVTPLPAGPRSDRRRHLFRRSPARPPSG